MSGAGGRRRRLGAGGERLTPWADAASDEDFELVHGVLFAVMDGSWVDRFVHYDDVTRKSQVVIEARPGLVVVVRFPVEYSDSFALIYVGSADEA